MGCLGAGCHCGSPALLGEDTVLPWAVRYYRRGMVPEPLLGLPLHPSPLYEALGGVGLLLFLRWSQRRPGAWVRSGWASWLRAAR